MQKTPFIYSYSALCRRPESAASKIFVESIHHDSGYYRGLFTAPSITQSNGRNGHGLSHFSAAIEAGKLAASSILAIDNTALLGYLEDDKDALNRFRRLIELGIDIHCIDGNRYNAATMAATNDGILYGLAALITSEKNKKNNRSKKKTDSLNNAIKQTLLQKNKTHRIGNIPSWITKTENNITLNEGAETIRNIAHLYIDGYGTSSIAKKLNEEGKKSPRNNNWSAASIRKILTNSALYGEAKINSDGVDYSLPDYYPKVIDITSYRSIESRLKSSTNRRSNNNESHLFSGLGILFCGHCGNTITIAAKTKNNSGRLCCRNNGQGQHQKTTARSICNEKLERTIINFIDNIQLPAIKDDNGNHLYIAETKRIIARLSSAVIGGGDLDTTKDQLKEYKYLLEKLNIENTKDHEIKYKLKKAIYVKKQITKNKNKNKIIKDYRCMLSNSVRCIAIQWHQNRSVSLEITLLWGQHHSLHIER